MQDQNPNRLCGEGSEEDKEGKEGRESGCYREREEDKERKVYDLPGQKRDPPEERDPLRIFYESLQEQIPTGENDTNLVSFQGDVLLMFLFLNLIC
ncbi:hypothetical protein QL285_038849 [Trifolium repens]|nr:hypothetical protein QL285_038849 [Trifolium repens]